MQRLEAARLIQDAITQHTPFNADELMSHDGALTICVEAPGGDEFYLTLDLERGREVSGEPPPSETLCVDCAVETIHDEFYIVENDVWSAAQGPDDGCLCIGCLETRLGRQLHGGDFKDVPLNRTGQRSARLSSRMTRLTQT